MSDDWRDKPEAVANCAACPFAVGGKPPHRPVLSEAVARPSGVLVGEGPGVNEVKEGRPFVGTTGRALNQILKEASLDRSELAVLNATACQPPKGKTDSMMRAAVKCCAPLFTKQYAPIKHLPTLGMGKWASAAVSHVRTGRLEPASIKMARGFLRDNATLILTWHPTYAIFHNAWERANFEVDVHRFSRMVRGRLLIDEPELHSDSLPHLLALCKEPSLAVDIETRAVSTESSWTGKDPTRALLRCIGLGSIRLAVSCSSASLVPAKEFRAAIAEFLAGQQKVKVFQNGWYFDIPVLQRYGFEVK